MDELNGILQKTKDKSTQKEQDEVATSEKDTTTHNQLTVPLASGTWTLTFLSCLSVVSVYWPQKPSTLTLRLFSSSLVAYLHATVAIAHASASTTNKHTHRFYCSLLRTYNKFLANSFAPSWPWPSITGCSYRLKSWRRLARLYKCYIIPVYCEFKLFIYI